MFRPTLMPEPPVCVPLRILGLNHMPADKAVVRQAFRFKMFAAHPDLNPDHPPVKAQADVQELVWARDWLVRKIPDPVTPEEAQRRETWRRNREAYEKATACPACRGTRKRPDGKPYHQKWRRGRWYRYCRPCAGDAERQRLRELRAQSRAARPAQICQNTLCDNVFTPARADGRFCSAACRQSAYRQRREARL
jgi:hypothetical protein